MFRPFTYISAAFISGIIIQSILSLTDTGLIFSSIICMIISIALFFNNSINRSFIFLIVTFFFLGGLHLASEDGTLPENHIKNLVAYGRLDTEKTAEIIFKLSDFPEPVENGYRLKCNAMRIRQKTKSYDCEGIFTVFCRSTGNEKSVDDIHSLAAGDTCRIISKLRPIQRYMNGFEGRYEDYRIREKQYFTSSVPSLQAVQVIKKASKWNISNLAHAQKAGLAAKIDRYFRNEEASVLKAVTLGSVDEELTDLRHQLRMSGIFHIVSVSGIHFSILAVSLIFFFKLIGLPLKRRYSFTILFLIFFCLIVGAYPSVLRATLMACLYFAAKLLSKESDFLNTISLASLVILLLNPMNLFSPGFQFTFIVSFFIFHFLEKFSNPETHGVSRKSSEILLVSAAAFLASLPLNAYHFNQISIISILNNILLVPLMFIAMNGALIFFLIVIIGVPLVGLIEPILSIVCRCIIELSAMSYNVPFLSYRIPAPHILLLIIYFIILMNIIYRIKMRKRYLFQSIVFAIIAFIIAIHPISPSETDGTTLEMLDVGQGQSIYIKTSEGKCILIDGGGNNSYSEFMGERILSKFLWSKGIKKIDVLILTHSHYDHIGGLWPVARNFRVSEFWENGLNPKDDVGYKLLKDNLDPKCEKTIIREGFSRNIDDIQILCLSPEKSQDVPLKTRNDDSLVLLFKGDSFSFLITGDIEAQIAEKIAEKYGESVRADILQVPHHGSPKSISELFYSKARPHSALISAGKGNIFGFPSNKILKLLKTNGISVFRTDFQGKISITQSDGLNMINTVR